MKLLSWFPAFYLAKKIDLIFHHISNGMNGLQGIEICKFKKKYNTKDEKIDADILTMKDKRRQL